MAACTAESQVSLNPRNYDTPDFDHLFAVAVEFTFGSLKAQLKAVVWSILEEGLDRVERDIRGLVEMCSGGKQAVWP